MQSIKGNHFCVHFLLQALDPLQTTSPKHHIKVVLKFIIVNNTPLK
jgi:hypothetical protein